MNPVQKKFADEGGDDEESQTNLVNVNNNTIMFHADVDAETCFKLIQCINKAKKYVAMNNILSEFDVPMKIYLHICSNGGDIYPTLAVIDTILSSKIDIVIHQKLTSIM